MEEPELKQVLHVLDFDYIHIIMYVCIYIYIGCLIFVLLYV